MNGTIKMAQRPRLIGIEGNIGAGKSTALQILQSHYNDGRCAAFAEPVHAWKRLDSVLLNNSFNLLDRYYKDRRRYAMSVEVFFLNSYTTELKDFYDSALQANAELLLTERTVASPLLIFGQLLLEDGDLCTEELAVLEHQSRTLASILPPLFQYDTIVYIDCPPTVCQQRCRQRNRAEETTITVQYLEQLADVYRRQLVNSRNNYKTMLGCDKLHVVQSDCSFDVFHNRLIEIASRL